MDLTKWNYIYASINSFSPGRFGNDFKSMIFKLIIVARAFAMNYSQVNATEPGLWEVGID